MRAVQFTALDQMIVADVAKPVAAEGEALVQVKAAALNHRDLWIKQGQYPGLKWPIIPGSDGAGVVAELNGASGGVAIGDEVIINPACNWGEAERAQVDTFSILGLPRNGTLAEYVTVPVSQLSRKPAHLNWSEAAALPLAGLTAYRTLFSRADLKAGEKVLINGVGGGVALFAMQFAVAAGAEVWVTSSDPVKIQSAIALGAAGGFDYNEKGWTRKAGAAVTGFDVVVESAGGTGFERLVDVANPGGRIVFFGATRGDPASLPMRKIFWKQLSLLGTTMGSPADWAEMIKFVDEHRVKPLIGEPLVLDQIEIAFDLMARGAQFGKIVVVI